LERKIIAEAAGGVGQEEKPMAKSKSASSFRGVWHIVSLTGWKEDFLDGEVQAFIELEPKEIGAMEFAYVRATLDYRLAQREGKPAVEFSWSGVADTAPVCGGGWAVRDGDERGAFPSALSTARPFGTPPACR
jgi:hypothetical protein